MGACACLAVHDRGAPMTGVQQLLGEQAIFLDESLLFSPILREALVDICGTLLPPCDRWREREEGRERDEDAKSRETHTGLRGLGLSS